MPEPEAFPPSGLLSPSAPDARRHIRILGSASAAEDGRRVEE